MPMSVLTWFQFLGVLSAYLLVAMALPCAVLHKKMSHFRFLDRALLYFIVGNFYVTNLVLLLETLHISHFITILVGLVVIPWIVWCKMYKYPVGEGLRAVRHFLYKVLTGSMGLRSILLMAREKLGKLLSRVLARIGASLRRDWPDWLLTAALVFMVLFVYGVRMVNEFGYTASDIPVHLYWVNALNENTLFAEGIYPYGMHAIIYLIHTAFGIDTYVVFRVYALVQCFSVHMMALVFLRLCCKSRFAAYAGVFLYTIGSYILSANIVRYLAVLPQETSMIYILPTVYFAILFFRIKSKELAAETGEQNTAPGKTEAAPAELEGAALAADYDEDEEWDDVDEWPDLKWPFEWKKLFFGTKREEESAIESLAGTVEAEQPKNTEILAEPAVPAQPEVAEIPEIPAAMGEVAAAALLDDYDEDEEWDDVDEWPELTLPEIEWKRILRTQSTLALAGLAMSFALSLSAHTYGAFVAALFCIGVALGHIRWFIKPAFFTRIAAAALISITIAALPMGIAYLQGTPIEDSYKWATGIVTSSIQQQEAAAAAAAAEGTAGAAQGGGAAGAEGDEAAAPEKVTTFGKVKQWFVTFWDTTGLNLESRILGFTAKPSAVLGRDIQWSFILRVMILFVVAAGAVLLLFKREQLYGAMLLSAGIFMLLISLLISSFELGIPVLIDADRTSIFYAYMLIVLIGFALDVSAYFLNILLGKRWRMDVISFAAVILLVTFMWQEGDVRDAFDENGLETNEAVTCLTNIIATEQDNMWTIFSANDETQMVYGHGYHYELSTFLEEIEPEDREPVTVPTPIVYFFIEKIPVDYTTPYWGSGQSVSTKGAQYELPGATWNDAYLGVNRWIIMSRMYYWALEFKRMYPNDMTVYMETDQFICYRLEQNAYNLFDLAIDYGYNSKPSEE